MENNKRKKEFYFINLIDINFNVLDKFTIFENFIIVVPQMKLRYPDTSTTSSSFTC